MTSNLPQGVDASRWPDIAGAPSSPLRARVAFALLRRIIRRVPVTVELPDGSVHGATSGTAPVMQIKSDRLFHRLGADLKIGLGESYMAGEWRPAPGSDLADVMTPFAAVLDKIVPDWMRRFRKLVEPRHPEHEENSTTGARSNISRHYDLSNEMFEAFLDETMTYSSAWFEDRANAGWPELAAAQRRKIDGILDFAGVTAGTKLLEIGTGWGQLSLQAAARGAEVHTITLSAEQAALAHERVAAAGLSDRVRIELRDYRDLNETYDAVVSVEMIEAVGEKYWPTYFQAVSDHLRPGGRFGLQAITMSHARLIESMHAYTWIHKYIFPGGLIPSVDVVEAEGRRSGMSIADRRSLGQDYALTLKLWRARFNEQHERIAQLGFDPTFERMWEFYLAYSEAGFRSGHLDVWQFGMVKQ